MIGDDDLKTRRQLRDGVKYEAEQPRNLFAVARSWS